MILSHATIPQEQYMDFLRDFAAAPFLTNGRNFVTTAIESGNLKIGILLREDRELTKEIKDSTGRKEEVKISDAMFVNDDTPDEQQHITNQFEAAANDETYGEADFSVSDEAPEKVPTEVKPVEAASAPKIPTH